MSFVRGAYAEEFCNLPTGSSVTLGFNVPQSGPYADEGADELRAYRLAVKHLNGEGDGGMLSTFSSKALKGNGILGKKVEYVTGDTQTKSDAARASAKRMATFGIDGHEGAGSVQALRAAERILLDFDRWRTEEPGLIPICDAGIGIGIASGPVAFGAVGQENRLEITVIGSAVNNSAKLEKHNRAMGSRLIVAANTYREAMENGYDGNLRAEHHTARPDGADPQEIVVLSLPGSADLPLPIGQDVEVVKRPA